MKKTLLTSIGIMFLMNLSMVAQVAINKDGSLPDNSALLDVKSTEKGILIPRLTQAQRVAIVSPANGLMVYQTDEASGYYYNSGTGDSPAWSWVGDLKLPYENSGSYDLAALKPVRFYYKKGNPRELASDEEQIGFVAQDVQKVFPEAVKECKDGYLDLNIHPINVALVNAVKELKAEVDRLKAENSKLRETDDRLEARLSALEKSLGIASIK